ncbi:hypothetical protein YC2023_002565 [Brassica napus]
MEQARESVGEIGKAIAAVQTVTSEMGKLEYIERHMALIFSNGRGSVDAINNKPKLI